MQEGEQFGIFGVLFEGVWHKYQHSEAVRKGTEALVDGLYFTVCIIRHTIYYVSEINTVTMIEHSRILSAYHKRVNPPSVSARFLNSVDLSRRIDGL
jgi:hypothetical protein